MNSYTISCTQNCAACVDQRCVECISGYKLAENVCTALSQHGITNSVLIAIIVSALLTIVAFSLIIIFWRKSKHK